MRANEILKYCKGEVLDIGCLQHDVLQSYSDNWIHGVLSRKFDTVGIDIHEDVLKLRKRGYNVFQANAENFNLNKKFDTIVAGELIEHLSNPGKFLESVCNHLKEGGKLILTTPNPFCIYHIIRRVVNKKSYINPDHCTWFDEITLSQLADKHGLKLINIKYIKPPKKGITWLLYVFGIKNLGSASFLTVFAKKDG